MDLKDILRVRGHIRIAKYDVGGRLYGVTEAENIFLTAGINEIWSLVTGQSANTFSSAQALIGIGDSSTTAAAPSNRPVPTGMDERTPHRDGRARAHRG